MFHHLPLAARSAFDWSYITNNIFDSTILKGAVLTVLLAVLSQLTGTLIGLLLYLLRRAKNPIPRAIADGYVLLFRGTPLLVQIFILFNLFPLVPGLVRALKVNDIFVNSGFVDNTYLLYPFLAGFIAFSLNEGAYMAEIVRAGIDSIDVGQMEASKSLGMGYGLAMRRIILPQAARVIVPPLGNEFNSMLKTTSLAYGIGLLDLFGAANNIATSSFRYLELFIVAAFWYLIMTTIWSLIQANIERRLNASSRDQGGDSFINRLLGRTGTRAELETPASEAILTGGRR
jgi:polar amino acid transport system permease protein